MSGLAGRTMLMSGGSRGIGLAIALRAARSGANVAMLAKTDKPHPKLDGTIYSAAQQIEEAGGRALPIVGDVRDEAAVRSAVASTVEAFGGIDICLNNASAIDLRSVDGIEMKRYDLMQDVNPRGTFLLSKLCVPHLRRSVNPHILTLSPLINLATRWAGSSLAYMISKYGMSLCTVGLARELAGEGIAANSLWPRTTIATAAVENLNGASAMRRARRPEIMADAAYAILLRSGREHTGNFYLDDEVLAEEGMTDLSQYACDISCPPDRDIFLD